MPDEEAVDTDAEPLIAAGWPRFDRDLRRALRAAWPEMNGPKHPIFRLTQMERVAWRNRFDFNKLETPWCVWGCPATTSAEGWGACNTVYNPRITVYYIASSIVAGEQDITTHVQKKLSQLEEVLKNQEYDGFQYWPGETTYDLSDENPANAVFIHANQPMFAGSFSFSCVFGQVSKRLPYPDPEPDPDPDPDAP